MPNLYMCIIQMLSKYVWGIGLIASSSESRHVVLFQSRVREGAQKGGGGVNDVYFIKTHVLGHLSQFQFENLTPAATFIK